MITLRNLSVLTSFFCLWLTSYLNEQSEQIVGFILILSFGILHGSNDIFLFSKQNNLQNKFSSKFLIYYLITLLTVVLVFYIIPLIGIIGFVIISAFHFGEQESKESLEKYSNKNVVYNFMLGFGILNLLFLNNISEVETILSTITKIKIEITYLKKMIQTLLIISFCYLIYVILLKYKSENFIIKITFQFILLQIIFSFSNLIWGFAIYFVFWHSLPSIYYQIKYLYNEISLNTVVDYIKDGFYYWLISLIGLFIMFMASNYIKDFEALFFSFLAAVTLPHAIIINKMFNKNYSL